MSEGGEGESLLVKLTRMEGKLDLSNLRHQQIDDWRVTVDHRLHRHGNELMAVRGEVKSLAGMPPRLDTLEKAHSAQQAERLGITKTLKIAWLIGGGGATAFLMAVARKAGLL